MKDVDGLVLDLRGGWGGAQPEYAELFVGGAPIMTYVGRDGREAFASFRWRRPVVVLVDEGTRSGKEVVTYGLKRQGVRVVGTRTAGALLAARGFLLRDGSLLVLAVSDVRVEGERLEGGALCRMSSCLSACPTRLGTTRSSTPRSRSWRRNL